MSLSFSLPQFYFYMSKKLAQFSVPAIAIAIRSEGFIDFATLTAVSVVQSLSYLSVALRTFPLLLGAQGPPSGYVRNCLLVQSGSKLTEWESFLCVIPHLLQPKPRNHCNQGGMISDYLKTISKPKQAVDIYIEACHNNVCMFHREQVQH